MRNTHIWKLVSLQLIFFQYHYMWNKVYIYTSWLNCFIKICLWTKDFFNDLATTCCLKCTVIPLTRWITQIIFDWMSFSAWKKNTRTSLQDTKNLCTAEDTEAFPRHPCIVIEFFPHNKYRWRANGITI